LIEILSLQPQDKQRLYPYALKRINDWEADFLKKAPQLNAQEIKVDLDTYLNDDEKAEFQKSVADVRKWVDGCMDKGDGYWSYAYSRWVIYPMIRIQLLIERVYSLKAEKAEMEQRKREYEERWQLACKAVNPPLNDAKVYFSDEEYDDFIKATRQAILVYTEKGEDYLSDPRSFDYSRYLELIHNRKEKERQLILAKLAAQEFNRRLNEEKVKLQALLSPNKKAPESYFRKQVRDHRYTGQDFSRFLSKQEEQNFDKTLVEISRKKAEELVSTDFRPFIASECWRSYFLLPSTYYILKEVPCLSFMFDVFSVVEIGVWLKPRQMKFDGYLFDLPWKDEKKNSSIKTPEFLGYHYVVLTPEELGGWSFWQNIPLVLLKGLLGGETRPSGTVIISASSYGMTYEVEGFEEEVEIPTQFAEYLERIGNIDDMVSMGVMTEKVGNIVKAALGELQVKCKIPSAIEKGRRIDSMKERVFQLFDEGKRPSDPEVKALGIKPNTAYRYYQDWKKTKNHT
jgi:hypothetical protein